MTAFLTDKFMHDDSKFRKTCIKFGIKANTVFKPNPLCDCLAFSQQNFGIKTVKYFNAVRVIEFNPSSPPMEFLRTILDQGNKVSGFFFSFKFPW